MVERGQAPLPEGGRRRVVISGVTPQVECGRFPVKRSLGEEVVVEADVFADGHDVLAAALHFGHADDAELSELPMASLGNDRWRAAFPVQRLGRYRYTVSAWVDPFRTWRDGLQKKAAAGQDVEVDLRVGAQLVAEAAARATGDDRERLLEWQQRLSGAPEAGLAAALDARLLGLADRHPDRSAETTFERQLEVIADPVIARFSAWYELFPRSLGEGTEHGTLADVERHLPYVARMGFDVLYLPPIHPIGRTHRKGPNNRTTAAPDDPGSPWAIGGEEGGHTAVHPQLGTADDVRRLAEKARESGIELALDIAYQCSPDHPWVREHPEWFRHRPDGTIQYAENPPKKYQDIYPLDFECEDWQGLWRALLDVVLHWVDHGVRVFRVDNPHTKPFAFWEWLITTVKERHPETVFLSEAFTRPKVMYRLAKLGFTQSYNYFPWRNTKWELETYLTEVTRSEVAEYFRPNLWPNTPDILPEYLQTGGRPGFIARAVLAGTLGASYGIYGPAFELLAGVPVEPGREEYLDSEKYEIRDWELERPDSIRDIITRVNRARRENPALQRNDTLHFHPTDNDTLICYSKRTPDGENVVLAVVNLDPHHTQSGWVQLDLDELGVDPHQSFQAHDLIGEARFLWQGGRNYVSLNPHVTPAHLFRIRRRLRTERDFEYFL